MCVFPAYLNAYVDWERTLVLLKAPPRKHWWPGYEVRTVVVSGFAHFLLQELPVKAIADSSSSPTNIYIWNRHTLNTWPILYLRISTGVPFPGQS